jgi:hypothetical protein
VRNVGLVGQHAVWVLLRSQIIRASQPHCGSGSFRHISGAALPVQYHWAQFQCPLLGGSSWGGYCVILNRLLAIRAIAFVQATRTQRATAASSCLDCATTPVLPRGRQLSTCSLTGQPQRSDSIQDRQRQRKPDCVAQLATGTPPGYFDILTTHLPE